MKIIKAISWFLVVGGIALVIAGPAWSKLQTSRMHSLQKQMEELVANPDNISADSQVEKEFVKNMVTQMGRIGDAALHAMRLVYFGVLSSLIGFAGVCLSMSHEIKKRNPQPIGAR